MKSKPTTIFFALTLMLSTTFSKLNAQSFQEGKNAISLGYGFGTVIGSIASVYESDFGYSFSSTGPLYAKFEHAINDKMGFGLNIAYASYDFKWTEDPAV